LSAVRLALAAAWTLGCASTGAPPGGPERHTPPEITGISPDSGETKVNIRQVEFRFDEVVSDKPTGSATLEGLFLISPRDGSPDVSWHRSRITVAPRKGFRPNTAYRVTLLPGLTDLRGNVLKQGRTILFSTGETFPPFRIIGRVFDWESQNPANGAIVEAIWKQDTSLVYVTASDSSGQFDVGPLPAGQYTLRAIIDANSNRALDRNEKWDTTTANVTTNSPAGFELDAIERDTLPAAIVNVTVEDSVTLRLSFDKALDPALPLQPALVRVQRADSTALEVVQVQWAAAFERVKQARDSIARARTDSIAAARDTTRRPPPAAANVPAAPRGAPPVPGGARPAPPQPKPRALPPDKTIVISLSPNTRLTPGRYVVSARGLRNLLGRPNDVRRGFVVAPPADSTRRRPAPADSTRRPPLR
jgi:hypothetical protein